MSTKVSLLARVVLLVFLSVEGLRTDTDANLLADIADEPDTDANVLAEVTDVASSAGNQNSTAVADKSVSGGIDDLCKQTQARAWETRLNAFAALHHLGDLARDAMPCITRGLIDTDSDVRSMVMKCMTNLGKEHADKRQMAAISDKLESSEWKTRFRAMAAFDFIGGPAHPEAKHIVYHMADADADVRKLAYQVWKKIGRSTPEDAVRDIARLTKANYKRWQTRKRALDALNLLGDLAAPAAAEVTISLADTDDDCRKVASAVFGNIRRTTAAAVDVLCGRLKADSWKTRKINLDALYQVGSIVADRCLDQVTFLTVDTDPDVSKSARVVLQKLDKADHRAIEHLAAKWLNRDHPYQTRIRAMQALEWLSRRVDGGGSWAKPAMDDIITAMSDPDSDVQSLARKALDYIRKGDEKA